MEAFTVFTAAVSTKTPSSLWGFSREAAGLGYRRTNGCLSDGCVFLGVDLRPSSEKIILINY